MHRHSRKQSKPAAQPLFPAGNVCASAGALQALARNGQFVAELLGRHCRGDWDEMPETDADLNRSAVEQGSRILSVFHLFDETRLWIITEWDRSVTTIVLPHEY